MKKRIFTGLLLASLAVTLTAYAGGLKLDAWPFSAPVVADESSVATPSQGNIIFDHTSSTDGTFKGYNGNQWISFLGSSAGVPTGAVLPFAGTTAPSGYLIADGAAISRATYSELFAVVGTSFGEGDGSTTFNLPDLRGRFLRGVDDSTGRDPDAASRIAMATGGNTGDAVGSVQADAFQGHRPAYARPRGQV